MTQGAAIRRRAARLLVVDPDERILLFCMVDPARQHLGPAWFTPGGGLDDGETFDQAAVRELEEETGLRLSPELLGPCVWTCRSLFTYDGRLFDCEEQFRLVRVRAFRVDTSGYDEVERRGDMGHRWWTLPELAATSKRVYPTGLAGLLPDVLAGPWLGPPLRLPDDLDRAP